MKKTEVHPVEFESVYLDCVHELPDRPGIYFAMQEDEILYVGQSKNIRRRWQSHHKYIELLEFDRVRIHWVDSDGRPLLKQESEWIKLCRPPLNYKTVVYKKIKERKMIFEFPPFLSLLILVAIISSTIMIYAPYIFPFLESSIRYAVSIMGIILMYISFAGILSATVTMYHIKGLNQRREKLRKSSLVSKRKGIQG